MPDVLDDRPAQRLVTVDDPQPGAVRIEPAFDQIAEQRAHHPRALGGLFSRPQNVLVSLAIEAQQLDLPEWAVMWCAGKAERRGSKAACAALDGVKKCDLRADCALQGPQRGRPMPAMHRQPF